MRSLLAGVVILCMLSVAVAQTITDRAVSSKLVDSTMKVDAVPVKVLVYEVSGGLSSTRVLYDSDTKVILQYYPDEIGRMETSLDGARKLEVFEKADEAIKFIEKNKLQAPKLDIGVEVEVSK